MIARLPLSAPACRRRPARRPSARRSAPQLGGHLAGGGRLGAGEVH
ncbi:hypothetical protein ACPA9J_31650 [Pseudomonas aeruginosa]